MRTAQLRADDDVVDGNVDELDEVTYSTNEESQACHFNYFHRLPLITGKSCMSWEGSCSDLERETVSTNESHDQETDRRGEGDLLEL